MKLYCNCNADLRSTPYYCVYIIKQCLYKIFFFKVESEFMNKQNNSNGDHLFVIEDTYSLFSTFPKIQPFV